MPRVPRPLRSASPPPCTCIVAFGRSWPPRGSPRDLIGRREDSRRPIPRARRDISLIAWIGHDRAVALAVAGDPAGRIGRQRFGIAARCRRPADPRGPARMSGSRSAAAQSSTAAPITEADAAGRRPVRHRGRHACESDPDRPRRGHLRRRTAGWRARPRRELEAGGADAGRDSPRSKARSSTTARCSSRSPSTPRSPTAAP